MKTGLPLCLFPCQPHLCQFCTTSKFPHPPKGHTLNTSTFAKGELLHMDLAFLDNPSIHDVTSMLVIVNAMTHTLYGFFVLQISIFSLKLLETFSP